MSIDVSSLAAGMSGVRVDFWLKSNDSVAFGGWNVDAFELAQVELGTIGCGLPSLYCTSKPSSIPGCVPTLAYFGTPSA